MSDAVIFGLNYSHDRETGSQLYNWDRQTKIIATRFSGRYKADFARLLCEASTEETSRLVVHRYIRSLSFFLWSHILPQCGVSPVVTYGFGESCIGSLIYSKRLGELDSVPALFAFGQDDMQGVYILDEGENYPEGYEEFWFNNLLTRILISGKTEQEIRQLFSSNEFTGLDIIIQLGHSSFVVCGHREKIELFTKTFENSCNIVPYPGFGIFGHSAAEKYYNIHKKHVFSHYTYKMDSNDMRLYLPEKSSGKPVAVELLPKDLTLVLNSGRCIEPTDTFFDILGDFVTSKTLLPKVIESIKQKQPKRVFVIGPDEFLLEAINGIDPNLNLIAITHPQDLLKFKT